jgi:alkaline phosphatase D
MMAMIDRRAGPAKVFSTDSWSGYVHERTALVKYLADAKVKNPVVLSGDIHSNWANELRVDDREGRAPVVAAEFVGTSISSKGDGKPGDGAELRPNNPCLKYHDDHREYVRCDVTPARWLAEFRRVSVVSRPNAPVATAAAFVVQAGRPGVTRA